MKLWPSSSQRDAPTTGQYLEYGPLPQQALRQVLPGQLSGGLQLLVPVSGLRTKQHKNAESSNHPHRFLITCRVCLCVRLCPPGPVCAPRNPGGRCRRPRLERSPWRGLPAERSSCTPGKAWLSSQTGVSGLWSRTEMKKLSLPVCVVVVLKDHMMNEQKPKCSFN